MNKSTIWIFSLEPITTRYTQQWHEHFPKLLEHELGKKYNIVQLDGIQNNSQLTPGAFLNFSDTNYWKSSQLCAFLEHFNKGNTTKNDHFIFTDAWNPAIIQLKYMSDLLGLEWKLHGLWHAGSYDKWDFLGRLIGDAPWVRHAEKSFFYALDYNYFATDFHIDLFLYHQLDLGRTFDKEIVEELFETKKIIRSGWPMEYMVDTLAMYKELPKRNLILFPHRIAPEKQVEIFRDLKEQLPQYEFIVCQDTPLSKNEYHNLLGEAKLVFSANLQETLGISMFEGSIANAIPMVPDRLSYSEMFDKMWKYPTAWTESWDNYLVHRKELCDKIIDYMENYLEYAKCIPQQAYRLNKQFFTCNPLLNILK